RNAAGMLSSRSRRLKVVKSTASATNTPRWKAIQNQMLVDTGADRSMGRSLSQSQSAAAVPTRCRAASEKKGSQFAELRIKKTQPKNQMNKHLDAIDGQIAAKHL